MARDIGADGMSEAGRKCWLAEAETRAAGRDPPRVRVPAAEAGVAAAAQRELRAACRPGEGVTRLSRLSPRAAAGRAATCACSVHIVYGASAEGRGSLCLLSSVAWLPRAPP